MKKRIRKHAGGIAAVIFTLLFLCGNWGNCEKVFGADVEKMELSDGTASEELWDGEKYYQEEWNEERPEENGEEDTEEVPEENREENSEGEEIRNPFTLSLSGEPALKAGDVAVYEVALKNTGEEKISDIILNAAFSCPKVTWQWQEAPGLEFQEDRSVLSVLEPGQEVLLFLTAQLLPEQKEALTCTVTASQEDGVSLEDVCTSEMEPLKADFSVEKIADRSTAVAGEEISYEIRIQNTGELTLHSIITTERFLKEGIRAEFVEKEGVELNESKDKAFIPVLKPGECIVLKALVKLPEKDVEGELLNEVIVLAKETGEHEVTAQASVQALKLPETFTPVPAQIQSSAPEAQYEGKEIPKTEDGTKIGKMVALLAASVILCILLGQVMKGKRKH
ncbi:MAG: hypothetical protein Q4B37_06185 [Eubacteriales bacterium]|nr:hypothetical protein [Eubacteriales bacterium]